MLPGKVRFVTILAMPETILGDKLRLAREYHRPSLTQEAMATRLNLKRATYANFESGRINPSEKLISLVSDVLRIPLEWFYDERPGPPPLLATASPYGAALMAHPPAPLMTREAQPGVGRRKFPLIGTAGASAFPLEQEEATPDDFVEFSDELYRPERFAIQVQGNSMSRRIQHGDFILVQPSGNCEPGLLAVARNEAYEYVVKELIIKGDRKVLHPLEPGYDDIVPGEGWIMVGYAVGRRKERGRGRYIEEGDNAGLRAADESA